ncbi:hypothetical protein IMSAGC004_01582 [Bacteroidaceae bacterium]|nr:hypothetical protein IMSAGC004_01582 [Bacteroidaceae bacterium]
MVRHDLQSNKNGCQQTTRQIFPPISQNHTGYSGRNIGQGYKFPDVPGSYNDEKIRRKRPQHSPQ